MNNYFYSESTNSIDINYLQEQNKSLIMKFKNLNNHVRTI